MSEDTRYDQLEHDLAALRQAPSSALEVRVLAIPHKQPEVGHNAKRPMWLAMTASLVLVLVMFLASPMARAAMDQVERIIGPVFLTVSDRIPQNAHAMTVEGQSQSVDQVLSRAPWRISLPAYVPPGYVLCEEAEIWSPNEDIIEVAQFTWRSTDDALLELSVTAPNPTSPVHTVVGSDSTETVQVHGKDAVLVQGGWDQPTGQWMYQDETTTVIWVQDGLHYSLLAYGEHLLPDELLRIAESVR
jgi:hypothetical protein